MKYKQIHDTYMKKKVMAKKLAEELIKYLEDNGTEIEKSVSKTIISKDIKLLPYENLIKALDEKGVEYDKNEISDNYFPLEDVKACMGNVMSSAPYHHCPCPLCEKPSEELQWISFRSPQWTWDKLMGIGGPMSICPNCGCIVEFVPVLKN